MAWRTCTRVLVGIFPLQENAADKDGGASSPKVVTLPKKTCYVHAAEVSKRSNQENSMRYTVVLEREEDGGYVASVPALPGCVSQGDTRAEALKNIQEAIALYVEDCRDAGDPVPTEAGKEFVEVEAA
jgi:predicted RNase H-like HicB family nuclease